MLTNVNNLVGSCLVLTLVATSLVKLHSRAPVTKTIAADMHVGVSVAHRVLLGVCVLELLGAAGMATSVRPGATSVAVASLFIGFAVYRFRTSRISGSTTCACAGRARSARSDSRGDTVAYVAGPAVLAALTVLWGLTAPSRTIADPPLLSMVAFTVPFLAAIIGLARGALLGQPAT